MPKNFFTIYEIKKDRFFRKPAVIFGSNLEQQRDEKLAEIQKTYPHVYPFDHKNFTS